MQVFGLPRRVIRNGVDATRLLSSAGAGTRGRVDVVRRRRRAMRDGLTARRAAGAVGVPLSTLRRWEKRPELLSRRPRTARPPHLRRSVEGRVRELRKQFPAWGRGKIGAVLRREGHDISDSTVGRAIRDLVGRGRMAPVSAFTAQSRRSRRTRRPHAVRIPRALRAERPGQAVQVDTLTVALRPGRTVRHFTGIDRLSRWSAGMAASDATAASAARFLDRLVSSAPFRIRGRPGRRRLRVHGRVRGGVPAKGHHPRRAAAEIPEAERPRRKDAGHLAERVPQRSGHSF